MKSELKTPGLQRDVSTLIKQGLMLVLMQIVSGLLDHLPGADFLLGDRVSIALLLRFAIALGMATVLLLAYRQGSRLIRQGVVTVCVHGPSTVLIEASATKFANNTTLLIYVCLLYGIIMRGGEPLVVILTAASWPFTVIRLCSLALAVLAIVGIFIGASPLFQETGDALAGRVATHPAEAHDTQIKCPGCGVLDDAGSKFCRFCGRLLAEETAPPAAMPPPVICTRCGAAVKQPARFCPTCGKPV